MARRPGRSDFDIDVAVVGAGLAGLAAARKLKEAGRRPVLLEATDRVGGRQRSTRLAGQVLEEGAVFFGSNYPTLTTKLRETGLADELKVYATHSIGRFGIGPETTWLPVDLLQASNVPCSEKLALIPFALTVLPIMGEIRQSLGNEVTTRWARRLDGITASEWLTSRIGPKFINEVAGPFMEALGFAPARDWSALGAMQILAFGAMAELHGIQNGNSQLAERLAGSLDVRCDTPTVSIAPETSGVRLEVGHGPSTEALRARDLVLAVPAPIAARLTHGALRQAVKRFYYSSSIVVAAAVDSLAVDLPAVSIFSGEGHCYIRGVVAEQAIAGAPVVSYATLAHPWQYEYFDAPDTEIVEILIDFLDDVNTKPVKVLESRVVRWEHSVPVPVPGSLAMRDEARRLAAEVPHLRLAGDYLVSPSQEGALVSGVEAAEALLGT